MDIKDITATYSYLCSMKLLEGINLDRGGCILCTMHNIRYTLYTVHIYYVMYGVLLMYSVQMYSEQYIIKNLYCTVYSIGFWWCTVNCTSVYCTSKVHRTSHNIQYTYHNIHYALRNIHYALRNTHCTLRNVHCALRNIHQGYY